MAVQKGRGNMFRLESSPPKQWENMLCMFMNGYLLSLTSRLSVCGGHHYQHVFPGQEEIHQLEV